ncbi:MAG: Ig-like domain-containing protein, partial [Bacilli bacterium]|nr:Ig-like domain-containing protein [Bacilli bacterium]
VINKTKKNITLYKPEFVDDNELRAVKVVVDERSDEYFIIEYHEKQETYDSYAAEDSGIIVYRVNEKNKYLGNTSSGNQDHTFIFRPNETTLGAGLGDLTKATLNMKRPTLGKTLDSNKSAFDKDSIYYTDGTNSGIVVKVTSETTNSVTFDITFPEVKGSGTKDDPYIIETVDDFLYLMQLSTKNKYYKLTKDLDFKAIVDYPKIDFYGVFDGNNKTIRNVTATDTGIFRYVGDYNAQAKIYNLNVENLQVSSSKGDHLGGLASVIDNANINNVHLKSGKVTNVKNIYNNGIASTGGFGGSVSSSAVIQDSSSLLSVSSPQNVGGFIGINMNATIKNSYTNSVLSGNSNVGAFIGLQCITDNVYKIPENVFYNSLKLSNAVGSYVNSMHNVKALATNELAKGIVGVSIEEAISLNVNDVVDYSIKVNPNVSVNTTYSVVDSSIVKYADGKIRALKAGTTKLNANLKVGTGVMTLTSNVTVKGLPVVEVAISKIALNKINTELYVNKTLQLSATLSPSNHTIANKITWTSSNTNVASVDNNGKVTTKAVGTAIITGTTVNGKKATCTITVKAEPTKEVIIDKIALNKTNAELYVNKTLQLSATLTPSNHTMTNKITWTSSNSKVASVDNNGKVTTKAVGTAIITGTTVNGKKSTCTITVKAEPIKEVIIDKITLNKTNAELYVNKTLQLSATLV